MSWYPFKKLECDNCLKEFDLYMDGKGEVAQADFLCSDCYIKKLEKLIAMEEKN